MSVAPLENLCVDSPDIRKVLDFMMKYCFNVWDLNKPFPADIYSLLIQLPSSYLPFFSDDPTHFISRRFIKTLSDTPKYCLCEPCLFGKELTLCSIFKIRGTGVQIV